MSTFCGASGCVEIRELQRKFNDRPYVNLVGTCFRFLGYLFFFLLLLLDFLFFHSVAVFVFEDFVEFVSTVVFLFQHTKKSLTNK